MNTFFQLPDNVQDYINERFAYHGISGEEAYNHPGIFPDELKNIFMLQNLDYFFRRHIF